MRCSVPGSSVSFNCNNPVHVRGQCCPDCNGKLKILPVTANLNLLSERALSTLEQNFPSYLHKYNSQCVEIDFKPYANIIRYSAGSACTF